jgi:hypothetical protein
MNILVDLTHLEAVSPCLLESYEVKVTNNLCDPA